MRPLAAIRSGWLLLALSTAAWLPAFALADPATTSTTTSTNSVPKDPSRAIADDPKGTLARGLDLERKHQWTPALQVYRDAKLRWPASTDFDDRTRLCEMHLKLARRYGDQSFRNVLLRMPDDRAFALFDEMIDRIETHYVDPVALEPLVRRGFDNLEVALRDPQFAFLTMNAKGATAERVAWLRDQLRGRRDRLAVPDQIAARDQVALACELARKALAIPKAAVVMEFVFGACDALPDDYTAYLTPDKLDDMFAIIDGNFVGLGVELKIDPQGLRLVGVIRGGPASAAGLKAGDRIVAIGGKSVRGLGLDEAAGRLQGAEGTRVDIAVLRADGSRRDYQLVRRHVEVESVTQAKIVEPGSGVGYIQLAGFQKSSAEEVDRAIRSLRRQGMKYLVLDLRGNPGGLLNVAVDIADRFIDAGVIVSTRGRAPGQTQVYRARPDKPYTMDLAVLVDHDSASASEILAGALQELGRAVVIGDSTSYGKGSVQSIFELKSVPAGLKLTTAKFYSPKDRPYHKSGVVPDIPVTVRAKPVADPSAEDAEIPDLGDPATDPVLAIAVQQARRQMASRR